MPDLLDESENVSDIDASPDLPLQDMEDNVCVGNSPLRVCVAVDDFDWDIVLDDDGRNVSVRVLEGMKTVGDRLGLCVAVTERGMEFRLGVCVAVNTTSVAVL